MDLETFYNKILIIKQSCLNPLNCIRNEDHKKSLEV